MSKDAKEAAFQNDIIAEMEAGGWKLGTPAGYDRARALYTEDCLAFVKATQPKMWAKYEKQNPQNPDEAFLRKLAAQLNKTDPNATDKASRRFGTLGVLRNPLRDKSCEFRLCYFKPEHTLNPGLTANYEANISRVVSELVYSPNATAEHEKLTGTKAKAYRIDLVLFVNGIPVVTLELKSTFKQSVQSAIAQYKKTRLPKDPETKKPEPLLTFKRGALVHFAVSQAEAYMTTHLRGADTYFLPFNRGTKEGGAGNDTPQDVNNYATGYLWNEVLSPANLLDIIGRFIHLEITHKETWEGKKYKRETLIFPRYHQWHCVKTLVDTSKEEGPGHKYLVQHSAGSGKSNSIAWTAHQLTKLYDEQGEKQFHSVIVVTDRTVLDDQLQDTIYQFEHKDGVVGRITKEVGQGSKSEKLAAALEASTPIIIVTIQTFPHVLKAIENSAELKTRNYAIIADEAHSSQTGRTAGIMKATLAKPDEADEEADEESEATEELSEGEIQLANAMAAKGPSSNLSYYAFTATPKHKTLELFGRLPKPDEPPSKKNKPRPFHVYSMRQAIEEGYILDVLKNYTNYKLAYKLAQKVGAGDSQVDTKKAKVKLGQWVKLHDYNIAQKVQVIVEHFKDNVMGLLGGQAKAMVVTGSRKEAVRYKHALDKYIAKKAKAGPGYDDVRALIAFSGEVTFSEKDIASFNDGGKAVLGESYTEKNMNPDLLGLDIRGAFDTDSYNVMIVAKKFQTGFDQPKLCAMYVDKKLGGVECVQTLSRLNRIYDGKTETYVLDFFNDSADILSAFQEYYQTAKLLDVSDPNIVWDVFEKLKDAQIFLWTEVVQFSEVFFMKSKSNAALTNVCAPARDRWKDRFKKARDDAKKYKELLKAAKKTGDATLIANADGGLKEATAELDALGVFRSDLVSFTRYYEFMSQIVSYEDPDLERLSLYARHLAPLLRESAVDEDDIDLSSVQLSHYRLAKLKQQNLKLVAKDGDGLKPGEPGKGKGRSKEEAWLSQIIQRLNDLFITDELTEKDLINYAYTIRDKISENAAVMNQIDNNSPEQALLGDFSDALDDAVMESGEAHQNQMMQYLNNKDLQRGFQRVVFDMLLAQRGAAASGQS